MTTPLPTVVLALSLADAYALYAAGVADGSGETAPELRAPLHALLTTLRGRWMDAHGNELLGALDDAPAWLAMQQTLKERTI